MTGKEYYRNVMFFEYLLGNFGAVSVFSKVNVHQNERNFRV